MALFSGVQISNLLRLHDFELHCRLIGILDPKKTVIMEGDMSCAIASFHIDSLAITNLS